MFWLGLLFALFTRITAQQQVNSTAVATNCEENSTWTDKGIKFKCVTNATYRGYVPDACNNAGVEVKPGGTWKTQYFEYRCNQPNTGTVNFEIINCINPSGKVVAVGSSISDGGSVWKCVRNTDGSVSFTSKIESECTFEGAAKAEKATWFKGSVQLQCQRINGSLVIRASGCLASDGKTVVSIGAIRAIGDQTFLCNVTAGDSMQCSLVEMDVGACTDSKGVVYQIGATYSDGANRYNCKLVGKKATPTVTGCLTTVSTKIMFAANGDVMKLPNGTFQQCRSVGKGAVPSLNDIPPSDTTCTVNNVTYNMLDTFRTGDIEYRCFVDGNGKPTVFLRGCRAANAKNISTLFSQNQYNVISLTLVYQCVVIKGVATYYQLSNSETKAYYEAQKSGNAAEFSVSGAGGSGTGDGSIIEIANIPTVGPATTTTVTTTKTNTAAPTTTTEKLTKSPAVTTKPTEPPPVLTTEATKAPKVTTEVVTEPAVVTTEPTDERHDDAGNGGDDDGKGNGKGQGGGSDNDNDEDGGKVQPKVSPKGRPSGSGADRGDKSPGNSSAEHVGGKKPAKKGEKGAGKDSSSKSKEMGGGSSGHHGKDQMLPSNGSCDAKQEIYSDEFRRCLCKRGYARNSKNQCEEIRCTC